MCVNLGIVAFIILNVDPRNYTNFFWVMIIPMLVGRGIVLAQSYEWNYHDLYNSYPKG